MPTQHAYVPDEDGLGCVHCGLPERNRFHSPARLDPVAPAPATPVVHADQAATSIDAAMCMDWMRSGAVKALVYRAVAAAGPTGLTDDELMHTPALAEKNPNTVRPRRIDLAREGVIVEARDGLGNPVTRTTRGGAEATVWILSGAAMAAHTAAARTLGDVA